MTHAQKHKLAGRDHSLEGLTDGVLEIYTDGGVKRLRSNPDAGGGAALQAVEYPAVLTADGWEEVDGGWNQTVNCQNNGNGLVGVDTTADDAAYTSAAAGKLRVIARTATTITVRAIGDKPTADIPIVNWEICND